jgi:peptidoglycan/LPS O-acetylase OafA/YrhL
VTFVEALLFWIAHALAPLLIFATVAVLLFAGVFVAAFVEHWLSKWKWRRIASRPRKAKEADQ